MSSIHTYLRCREHGQRHRDWASASAWASSRSSPSRCTPASPAFLFAPAFPFLPHLLPSLICHTPQPPTILHHHHSSQSQSQSHSPNTNCCHPPLTLASPSFSSLPAPQNPAPHELRLHSNRRLTRVPTRLRHKAASQNWLRSRPKAPLLAIRAGEVATEAQAEDAGEVGGEGEEEEEEEGEMLSSAGVKCSCALCGGARDPGEGCRDAISMICGGSV